MKHSRPRTLVRSIVLIAAIVLSGCKDSALGNTGDRMTLAEVNVLVNAIVPGFGFVLEVEGEEFAGEINQVIPCSAGGTYVRTGTYSGEQDAGYTNREMTAEFFDDHTNCEFAIDDGVLRLNGDPRVRHSVYHTDSGGIATYTFDVNGGIRFETPDAREGRCAIDLTVEFSIFNFQGGGDPVVVFGGRACGVSGSQLTLNVS